METVLTYLTKGVVLGLYVIATPGPFMAYLLAQALQMGWKRTLPIALTPLLSDLPVLLILLSLISQMPLWFFSVLKLVGGCYLIYLARSIFLQSRREPALQNQAVGAQTPTFAKAVLINWFNPNVYIFWGTIGGPIVLEGWRQAPAMGAGFMVGMYTILVGGTALIITLAGASSSRVPKWRGRASVLLAVFLLAFSAVQIIGALNGLKSA